MWLIFPVGSATFFSGERRSRKTQPPPQTAIKQLPTKATVNERTTAQSRRGERYRGKIGTRKIWSGKRRC